MYSVKREVLKGVLQKKFNSLVGYSCEAIEVFAYKNKIDIDSKETRQLIQKIKKLAYDTMRDIEGQVESFSNGTTIDVKLIRPDSK